MLLERARAQAGRTLHEIAEELDIAIDDDPRRTKGLAGRLLERRLGATAGSRSAPDFEALGVELKTIPVDREGRPRESTFVSTIDLLQIAETSWERSAVWRKLRRVLWVPIEHDRALPLRERRVGSAILWTPSPEQARILRVDWEDLAEQIAAGNVQEIDARLGEALQIRPKAPDSAARTPAFDEEGAMIWSLPRGFYLRARFTATILAMSC